MNGILLLCILIFTLSLCVFFKKPSLNIDELANKIFYKGLELFHTADIEIKDTNYNKIKLYICFVIFTMFIYEFNFKKKNISIDLYTPVLNISKDEFKKVLTQNDIETLFIDANYTFFEAWNNSSSFLEDTVTFFMDFSELSNCKNTIEISLIVMTIIEKISIDSHNEVEKIINKYKIN